MTDLAILYEHPTWFRPLFAALDRRGVAYVALDATDLSLDPASGPPAPVIFNRVAMSSFIRSPEHPIYFAQAALAQWESAGARVINGSMAMAIDSSKARQLALLSQLGLAAPRTRVVHRAADLLGAAEGLAFPVLVKANVGGSGAGIARYDTPAALAAAVAAGETPTSIDAVLLVQEYATARGGESIRLETLGGRFLYAVAVNGGGAFDLCLADACQIGSPVTLRSIQPAPAWIEAAERIVAAAGIEVGGVELLIDERDGSALIYDINAVSNFVADPLAVLGWEPHERLVDWLCAQLGSKPLRKAA